ncbi:MAG: DUF6106 family protein [Eubacterium sp.]
MEEVFVERIIKRRTSGTGILLRLLSVLIVLISMFAIFFLGMLGITITVLLGYLAYLCWSYTSIEYEYSFLNGELTIDKIMGQRKRKTVDTYDVKKAEVVAPSSSDEIIRRIGNIKKIDYSSGYKSNSLYSIIVNNGAGTVQVIFEPDEKMLDAMYHVRPNIVKKA